MTSIVFCEILEDEPDRVVVCHSARGRWAVCLRSSLWQGVSVNSDGNPVFKELKQGGKDYTKIKSLEPDGPGFQTSSVTPS